MTIILNTYASYSAMHLKDMLKSIVNKLYENEPKSNSCN